MLLTALWGDRQYHTARTYGVAALVILLLALLIAPNDTRQLEVVVGYKTSRRAALNGGNKRYPCGNRREEQASLLTHNVQNTTVVRLIESQGRVARTQETPADEPAIHDHPIGVSSRPWRIPKTSQSMS